LGLGNSKRVDFIWNKGIHGVFGYKKEDVGENFQWWFDKIHPEDSLKMSVKVFTLLNKKPKNGKTNIVLNVLMEVINTFSIEVF
jgi:hypothetical protein